MKNSQLNFCTLQHPYKVFFLFSLFLVIFSENIKLNMGIETYFSMTRSAITFQLKIAWNWRIFRMHVLTRCRNRHLPYADGIVAVTSEQSLAIGWPGKRQTLWWIGLDVLWNNFWAQFFDWFFACQILFISKKKSRK